MAEPAPLNLEILRSAMDSAKETIKACVLINGGAALAVLTFIGHVATQNNKYQGLIQQLAPSLIWFEAGLVAAVLGHGGSYYSNLNFARGEWQSGQGWRILVLVFTFVSICFFAGGSYQGYQAFAHAAAITTKSEATIQNVK